MTLLIALLLLEHTDHANVWTIIGTILLWVLHLTYDVRDWF